MTESVAPSAAPTEFEHDIAEMWGDAFTASEPDETPAPTADAAGEPSEDTSAAPENAPDAAVAPDASADAVAPAADGTTASPAPTDDPLKDYTPLAYGDGQQFEGVYVHKDGGAVIDPETVPKLVEALQHAQTVERDYQEAVTARETADRLSQWPLFAADGKTITRTITGPDAVVAMRARLAEALAAEQVYARVLNNVQELRALFAQDEQGNLILNPRELKALNLEIGIGRRDAAQNVARWAGQTRTAPPPAAVAPAETAAISWDAPTAEKAVGDLATSWGVKGLTPADVKMAAQQLPKYSHLATAVEAKANRSFVAGKTPVVENAFKDVLAYYVNLRAGSTTADKTGATNAARIAAANPKPPAKTVNPAQPVTAPRKPNQRAADADAWYKMQEAGAGGRFYSPTE